MAERYSPTNEASTALKARSKKQKPVASTQPTVEGGGTSLDAASRQWSKNIKRAQPAINSVRAGLGAAVDFVKGGANQITSAPALRRDIGILATTPRRNFIGTDAVNASNRQYAKNTGAPVNVTVDNPPEDNRFGGIGGLDNRSRRAVPPLVSQAGPVGPMRANANFEDFARGRQGINADGQYSLSGARRSGALDGSGRQILHNQNTVPNLDGETRGALVKDASQLQGVNSANGRVVSGASLRDLNNRRETGLLKNGAEYTYFKSPGDKMTPVEQEKYNSEVARAKRVNALGPVTKAKFPETGKGVPTADDIKKPTFTGNRAERARYEGELKALPERVAGYHQDKKTQADLEANLQDNAATIQKAQIKAQSDAEDRANKRYTLSDGQILTDSEGGIVSEGQAKIKDWKLGKVALGNDADGAPIEKSVYYRTGEDGKLEIQNNEQDQTLEQQYPEQAEKIAVARERGYSDEQIRKSLQKHLHGGA